MLVELQEKMANSMQDGRFTISSNLAADLIM
jgi:hypothetical protein